MILNHNGGYAFLNFMHVRFMSDSDAGEGSEGGTADASGIGESSSGGDAFGGFGEGVNEYGGFADTGFGATLGDPVDSMSSFGVDPATDMGMTGIDPGEYDFSMPSDMTSTSTSPFSISKTISTAMKTLGFMTSLATGMMPKAMLGTMGAKPGNPPSATIDDPDMSGRIQGLNAKQNSYGSRGYSIGSAFGGLAVGHPGALVGGPTGFSMGVGLANRSDPGAAGYTSNVLGSAPESNFGTSFESGTSVADIDTTSGGEELAIQQIPIGTAYAATQDPRLFSPAILDSGRNQRRAIRSYR